MSSDVQNTDARCPECRGLDGGHKLQCSRRDSDRVILSMDLPVSPATTDRSEGSRKTIAKLSSDRAALIAELRKAAADRQHMGTNAQRFVRAADALERLQARIARIRAEAAAEALEEFAEDWATGDGIEALMFATDDVSAVQITEKLMLARAAAIRNQETGENHG